MRTRDVFRAKNAKVVGTKLVNVINKDLVNVNDTSLVKVTDKCCVKVVDKILTIRCAKTLSVKAEYVEYGLNLLNLRGSSRVPNTSDTDKSCSTCVDLNLFDNFVDQKLCNLSPRHSPIPVQRIYIISFVQ